MRGSHRLWIIILAWLTLMGSATATSGPPDRNLPWVTPTAQAPHGVQRIFHSMLVGGPVSYHAYVPAVQAEADRRLPVLYWLHGTLGGVAGVAAVAQLFEQAIRDGRIPPMSLKASAWAAMAPHALD